MKEIIGYFFVDCKNENEQSKKKKKKSSINPTVTLISVIKECVPLNCEKSGFFSLEVATLDTIFYKIHYMLYLKISSNMCDAFLHFVRK